MLDYANSYHGTDSMIPWTRVSKTRDILKRVFNNKRNTTDVSILRKNIIDNVDVLVDGPYIESLKDDELHWVGSSNQRVIDVRQTMKKINRKNLYTMDSNDIEKCVVLHTDKI